MPDRIDIEVSSTGAEQTKSQLNGVQRAVRGYRDVTGGLFGTLLGATLITGLFAGGLSGLVTSSGSASNALDTLLGAVEQLLEPIFMLLNRFTDWFAGLSGGQQVLLGLGAVMIWFAGRAVIGAVIGALGSLVLWIGRAIFAAGGLSLATLPLGGKLALIGSVILGIAAAVYLLITRWEELREAFSIPIPNLDRFGLLPQTGEGLGGITSRLLPNTDTRGGSPSSLFESFTAPQNRFEQGLVDFFGGFTTPQMGDTNIQVNNNYEASREAIRQVAREDRFDPNQYVHPR